MSFTTKLRLFSLFSRTVVNHKHRKMRRLLKRPTQYSGSQRLPDESDFRKIFQTATLLIRSWEQLLKSRTRINHCENHVFFNAGFIFQKMSFVTKIENMQIAFFNKIGILRRLQFIRPPVKDMSVLVRKSFADLGPISKESMVKGSVHLQS